MDRAPADCNTRNAMRSDLHRRSCVLLEPRPPTEFRKQDVHLHHQDIAGP